MKRAADHIDHLINTTIPRWLTVVSVYCRNSSSYFYWVLALLVTMVIAVVTLLQSDIAASDETTYDDIIQLRWESPAPTDDIIILDIDEKSLAEMTPRYGRWPWKRDVLAEALAELEYIEPKSILFTVMITDPDAEHPRSDAVLSFVASESFVTVYPVVRLPSKNDLYSKLNVCTLIPAGVSKCKTKTNVAVILPGLPGMRHDMAIDNHKLDDDGILRRWQLKWQEETWDMPTMIGGALALANIDPKTDPSEPYMLNWRDTDKSYQRVSFSDYIATLNGEDRIDPEIFAGKHVIIGSSAPGLTVKSSTSIGLLDDVDVLATALDDAVHGTNIKQLPEYVIPGVSVVLIWFLAYMFMFGRSQAFLDGLFVGVEGGAVVVMALAINYTTYFIDIMPLATYGLVFFSIARVHYEMAESIHRGAPSYLHQVADNELYNSIGIIAFSDKENQYVPIQRELLKLRKKFVSSEIFFTQESFVERQVFEEVNVLNTMVVLADRSNIEDILAHLIEVLTGNGMKDYVSEIFELPGQVKRSRELLPKFIAMRGLEVIARIPLYDVEKK